VIEGKIKDTNSPFGFRIAIARGHYGEEKFDIALSGSGERLEVSIMGETVVFNVHEIVAEAYDLIERRKKDGNKGHEQR